MVRTPITVFLLLAVPISGQAGIPQWNNTKCPAYWELQAPHVATDFKLEDIPGYYYELAFHDVTQRPLCPPPNKPACITSEKAVQTHSDGVKFVNDTWNLACFGKDYPQELLFNITENPGYLRGYVPVTKIPFLPKSVVAGMVFPDTVVDFKSGPEGWLLEMQCVEVCLLGLCHVDFVGINFYSKVKTEASFQEMYNAAISRGLGLWINSKPWGLSRVDHSNCSDEPGKTSSSETIFEGSSTYYKMVTVKGVPGCVQADVSSTVASLFGGKPGTCASQSCTTPTGSQKIPGCCTVQGFSCGNISLLADSTTYYKMVTVKGVPGCVQADVSSTLASLFGGKPGTCADQSCTTPTGSQKIPGCCTVQGYSCGKVSMLEAKDSTTYYKMVTVKGVPGCVQADVSSTVASLFGGKPGTCADQSCTTPTGSQKIPGCCTVQGYSCGKVVDLIV